MADAASADRPLVAARPSLLLRLNAFGVAPSLIIGICLLAALLLFSVVGHMVWDTSLADPLSATPNRPPSLGGNPFGTDSQGRDLLAVMILGTDLTLKVGVLSGLMGIVMGTLVGLIAAYYRGVVDLVARWIMDVGLTVPPLLLLVVIASAFRGQLSSTGMAVVIGSLAWFAPARRIRAQAIALRDAGFVLTARLGGMSGFSIIFREILPNLLPYLSASFVLAVSSAILSAIGLEALGLGPTDEPTLGMTIYWMLYYTALMRGLWWWILEPIVILAILFVGLFLISSGLDKFANPRLRSRVS